MYGFQIYREIRMKFYDSMWLVTCFHMVPIQGTREIFELHRIKALMVNLICSRRAYQYMWSSGNILCKTVVVTKASWRCAFLFCTRSGVAAARWQEQSQGHVPGAPPAVTALAGPPSRGGWLESPTWLRVTAALSSHPSQRPRDVLGDGASCSFSLY